MQFIMAQQQNATKQKGKKKRSFKQLIKEAADGKDTNQDDINALDDEIAELSYASKVIHYTPGSPWTTYPENMDPNIALGAPDLHSTGSSTSTGDYCMGAGGTLTLGFDIAIIDKPGIDLYVFEVGPDVEPTKVELSEDLQIWYEVGNVAGSVSGLDITGKVPDGGAFQFIRLTDLRTYPTGRWPGADIDAVCALNYISIE